MFVEADKYAVIDGIAVKDLKLMPHHVLVRWLRKTESRGGVLIPENRQRSGFTIGEVLSVGADCVEKLHPGLHIQFDSLADKEFLGPQEAGDRDTVFIMREEDVFGIIFRNDEDEITAMSPMNEYVLIAEADRNREEKGILVPGGLEKPMASIWNGVIVGLGERVTTEKKFMDLELIPGQRVVYETAMATEVKISGKMHAILRADYISCVVDGDHELAVA